ncbi:MAG: alternative ribosome rescue aminoacyl-tRNA hydrolase ArfB [Planctomycetota bacterium]
MPPADAQPGSVGGRSAEPSRLRLAPGAHADAASIEFVFVASSGPGGQNVNKRATKARLRLAVSEISMPEPARTRLRRLAGSQLSDADEIVIACDEHRSQKRNRDAAIGRLRTLVARAMVRPTPRKKTRPSRGAVERRLKQKRIRSETKSRRQKRPGAGDG